MPGQALVDELIHGRRRSAARWLLAPGPDPAQFDAILCAAAAAPDHGQLRPWRFVLIPADARHALGAVFAQALEERDPDAGEDALAQARAKAHRGPCLLLAVADLGPRPGRTVRDVERLVSLGAAIQNMLLASRAMGFGSGLLSGQALGSQALRRAFELGADEVPVCFVIIGTPGRTPSAHLRPVPAQILSRWDGGGRAPDQD